MPVSQRDAFVVARGSMEALAPVADAARSPAASLPLRWHLRSGGAATGPCVRPRARRAAALAAPWASITVTQNGWWPIGGDRWSCKLAQEQGGCASARGGGGGSSGQACGGALGGPWWQLGSAAAHQLGGEEQQQARQLQAAAKPRRRRKHQPEEQASAAEAASQQQHQQLEHRRKQQQQQQQAAPDPGGAPGQQPPRRARGASSPAPAAASTLAAGAIAIETLSGGAPKALHAVVLEHLEHGKLLVAGAMSAVVSRTAVAPLERVRGCFVCVEAGLAYESVKMDQLLRSSSHSALETAARVYQREGLRGFWKGNALNVARTAPFKALNFFSFDMYSRALAHHLGQDVGNLRFLAGAAAGITATLVCFPLDTLRTRMMAPGGHHRYGGPVATLRGIARHEGLGALYAGCLPAVVGMAPAGAVFYGVYDTLKSRHLRAAAAESGAGGGGGGVAGGKPAPELPAAYTLLYGALAGVASEICIYPLEVLRRRMQLQCAPAAAPGGASGAAALLRHHAPAAPPAASAAAAWRAHSSAAWGRVAMAAGAIWKEGGAGGFYAGLRPSLLQVLPSAALSYWVYETVKHALGAPL